MTRRLRLRTTPARPDIGWREWAASGARCRVAHADPGASTTCGASADHAVDRPGLQAARPLDPFHYASGLPRGRRRVRIARRLGDLCEDAHARGLRVVLDIIANHTGDNWGYLPPETGLDAIRNEPPYLAFPQFYGAAVGPGEGWSTALRDEQQQGSTSATGVHDGVWPIELRGTRHYTRAGAGSLGSGGLDDAHAEHKRTDFFALKDLALDNSDTLSALIDCYKY